MRKLFFDTLEIWSLSMNQLGIILSSNVIVQVSFWIKKIYKHNKIFFAIVQENVLSVLSSSVPDFF